MTKNVVRYLVLAGSLLGCEMVFAAPQSDQISVTTQTIAIASPTIPVRLALSQLKEGMNLLSTAANGYCLYAQVSQGQVKTYVVQDSNGNTVPCPQSQESGKVKVCWNPQNTQCCWEIE